MILTKYFIQLVLLGLLAIQSFAQENQSNVEQWFKERIQDIQMEQSFVNILIIRHKPNDCFLENLPNILEQPIWLSGDNNTFDLKQKFNSEVLALVCQQNQFDIVQLENLAIILNNMRHTRIIILAKDFSQPKDLYEPLMTFCEDNQFTNVIIVFDSLIKKNIFYRYSPYPKHQVILQSFERAKKIFPQHWLNFQGKVLYTLPEQYEPRSVLYMDPNGQQKLSGYVAKLIEVYAKKYNASLQFFFPLNVQQFIHSTVIKEFVSNRSLDLPICVAGLKTIRSFNELSYPIELSSLLTMVPTLGSISTKNIYLVILEKTLIIALILMIISFSVLFTIADREITLKTGKHLKIEFTNLILNDKVLPGILGQSYILHTKPKPAQRFLYFSIFVLGLTLNTLYAAHLKTLITTHPSLRAITSFNDLKKLNIYLLMDKADVKLTDDSNGPEILNKARDIIEATNTKTFRTQRGNLNTSYAYTVPSPIWRDFEEQQHFFARKLFFTPKLMLLIAMTHYCVPLPKNSVLKESFDLYIHHVHDAGLLQYWYGSTFRDMVSAKKISITDRPEIERFKNLGIQDLYWIWILIGCGYMLSTIVFLIELCISSVKSKTIVVQVT